MKKPLKIQNLFAKRPYRFPNNACTPKFNLVEQRTFQLDQMQMFLPSNIVSYISRFGDIYPRTDNERALAIIISSVGFVLFNGYLIGGLSSVISENARRLSNLRFRLGLMQRELVSQSFKQNATANLSSSF